MVSLIYSCEYLGVYALNIQLSLQLGDLFPVHLGTGAPFCGHQGLGQPVPHLLGLLNCLLTQGT